MSCSRTALRQPAIPAHRLGLARVFNELAILERFSEQRIPAAEQPGRRVRRDQQVVRPLGGPDPWLPDSAAYRAGLALALDSRAVALWKVTAPPEAIAEFERSRALHRNLVERFPAVSNYRLELGRTCNNLGAIYRQAGRPEDSARRYTEARDLYESLARENPTAFAFHRELANAWESLARLDFDAGRADQAIASLQRGRGLLEGLAREERGFGSYHLLLTQNLYNLGPRSGPPAGSGTHWRRTGGWSHLAKRSRSPTVSPHTAWPAATRGSARDSRRGRIRGCPGQGRGRLEPGHRAGLSRPPLDELRFRPPPPAIAVRLPAVDDGPGDAGRPVRPLLLTSRPKIDRAPSESSSGSVITEQLSEAVQVLDRFHVMQQFGGASTKFARPTQSGW